jgi:hypothetical protein
MKGTAGGGRRRSRLGGSRRNSPALNLRELDSGTRVARGGGDRPTRKKYCKLSSIESLEDRHGTRIHRPRDDHSSLRIWLRLLTCTQRDRAPRRARPARAVRTTLPRFD